MEAEVLMEDLHQLQILTHHPQLELAVVVVVEDQVVAVVQLVAEDLQQEHPLVNQVLQVLLQLIQVVVLVEEEWPVDQVEMVVVELL